MAVSNAFGNGHLMPSRHASVFISSADWMERKHGLARGKHLCLFTIRPCTAQVLDQIMVTNLKDSLQSWELSSDGTWTRVAPGRKPVFPCMITS